MPERSASDRRPAFALEQGPPASDETGSPATGDDRALHSAKGRRPPSAAPPKQTSILFGAKGRRRPSAVPHSAEESGAPGLPGRRRRDLAEGDGHLAEGRDEAKGCGEWWAVGGCP